MAILASVVSDDAKAYLSEADRCVMTLVLLTVLSVLVAGLMLELVLRVVYAVLGG